MHDDVLLPVALGEADNPALDRALDLAEQYDATLHLVSAVDAAVFDPMTVETGAIYEELEESAVETIETAERTEDRGPTSRRGSATVPPGRSWSTTPRR